MHLTVTFRRTEVDVDIEDDATLSDLGQVLSARTGASPETMKIFGHRLKSACQPWRTPGTKVKDTGIQPGNKLMLVASLPSEVAQVRAAVDMPGIIGFEEELLRYARRRNLRGTVAPKPPSGPYTFSRYKVLTLPSAKPGPDEALKLLHRLAADPGIVGIMKEHRFEVGLLSEMPPTDYMDDQRQVTCLLGLNVNQGQEIKLRLRTNDLLGFRKYDSIRETLVHELTHNVWGDHDNRFKTLNSQLLRECIRLSKGGIKLDSGTTYEGQEGDYLDEILQQDIAATKAARTLREAGPTLPAPASASEAAARAALARFQPHAPNTADALGTDAPVSGSTGSQAVEDIARAYEHEDAATQAEEEAMRALGTFADDQPPAAEALPASRDPLANAATTSATPPTQIAAGMQDERGAAVAAASDVAGTLTDNVRQSDASPDRTQSSQGPGLHAMGPAGADTAGAPALQAANASAHAGVNAESTNYEPMQLDDPSDALVGSLPDESVSACIDLTSDVGASTEASSSGAQQAGHRMHEARQQQGPAIQAGSAQPSTLESMNRAALELGVVGDDPMLQRAARVDEAMRDLEKAASQEQLLTALKTVHTIVSNSLNHPGNARFTSVRRSNKAFSQRVAAWPAAERLLQLAGFSLSDGDHWSLGSRQDPGMLWLVSNMIQNRVAQYAH